MHRPQRLLDQNRAWAARQLEEDPEFFADLAAQQTPKYLWIGCADSRVPANQITGLNPGEVFVHRNVANQVVHSDLNMLSCVQYAVDVLGVEHVIVCGHYGCGGVKAALFNQRAGLVDNWLGHIRDIARDHAEELEPLDEEARLDRMCELNAVIQRQNLAESTVIRDAWERGQFLHLHAWAYSLKTGLIDRLAEPITGPAA